MKKRERIKEKAKKDEKKPIDKYKIFKDALTIISVLTGIFSLYVSLLVRSDTAELTKFSDKPIYYTINLYPNDETYKAKVYDKYVSMDLTLVVDDFKIKKENFMDVNYNSVFTKTKYYMVYDYSLNDKDYKYMRYTLDDRTEGKMRFEEDYYVTPVKLNYSFTPNKNFCYLLIYTETTSEKNLDLVFFRYYDNEKTFTLDTIYEDGKEKIDLMRIDFDASICKDYFIDLWSEGDSISSSDIKFMFDVYSDLRSKLIS